MNKIQPFNGIRSVPSPCYDPKTKSDCPDRSAGCSKHCDKWRKHREDLRQKYKERERIGKATDSYCIARKTRGRDRHYGGG